MKNKLLILLCAFGVMLNFMVRLSAAPTLGEPVVTPATLGLQTATMEKEYADSVGYMVRIYDSAKDNKLRELLTKEGIFDRLTVNVQKINELENLVLNSGREINDSFIPLFLLLLEEESRLSSEVVDMLNLRMSEFVEMGIGVNHNPEAQKYLKDFKDEIVKAVNNYNNKYAKITDQLLQLLKQQS